MKIEPIGIIIIAASFFLITIWPGLEYWYVGTILFVIFMLWLAHQTFGKK